MLEWSEYQYLNDQQWDIGSRWINLSLLELLFGTMKWIDSRVQEAKMGLEVHQDGVKKASSLD